MRIADLDPGVLTTKIEKNVLLKFFKYFLIRNCNLQNLNFLKKCDIFFLNYNLLIPSLQPSKETPNTSKLESSFFYVSVLPSWIRIQPTNADPDPDPNHWAKSIGRTKQLHAG